MLTVITGFSVLLPLLSPQVLQLMGGDYKVLSDTIKARKEGGSLPKGSDDEAAS